MIVVAIEVDAVEIDIVDTESEPHNCVLTTSENVERVIVE